MPESRLQCQTWQTVIDDFVCHFLHMSFINHQAVVVHSHIPCISPHASSLLRQSSPSIPLSSSPTPSDKVSQSPQAPLANATCELYPCRSSIPNPNPPFSDQLRDSGRAESMSGPPEVRSVLGPAGNTRPRSAFEPVRKLKKSPAAAPEKDEDPLPKKKAGNGSVAATVLRQRQRQEGNLFSSLSMNASCSSDASTDSSQSRASTGRGRAMGRGRGSRRSLTPTTPVRRKQQQQCGMKNESLGAEEFAVAKKRCAWVTPNTDPSYAAFHDEEWGVPVYDDKNLFELLSLSTALAELSWPVILNKRQTFREVFQNFDPVAVSKLNDKKIAAPGSPGSSLLSEIKLRAIVENARQTCKIIEEFGSFEKYIWGFINYKPTVGHFRYQRQVPIKTSKADSISKDLVRRGFRGIGPTVIYSFMQVAGLTNDHLVSCFRFSECVAMVEARDKPDILIIDTNEANQHNDTLELGLERFSLSVSS